MCNRPEPFKQLKEHQPRIIPEGQNPISGLGEDVVWRNCLRTDGRTTDDGRNVITKAYLVTCYYVTGELKSKG